MENRGVTGEANNKHPTLRTCSTAINAMTEVTKTACGSAAQIEPELLTKAQTAQLLGVSTRTVDNLMRTHRISYVRLTAKMVRFPRAEILQHVRENLTIHAQAWQRS